MVSESRRLREAAWITACGIGVSAAPAFWYARVWPDAVSKYGSDSRGSWWLVFAFSMIPFIVIAFLREQGTMSLIAASVSTLLAGLVVIDGQYAGLNPNDPSSTASIALVIGPVLAAALVVPIYVVDDAIRSARSRRRQGDDSH
jgi:hypothetical protein